MKIIIKKVFNYFLKKILNIKIFFFQFFWECSLTRKIRESDLNYVQKLISRAINHISFLSFFFSDFFSFYA